MKRTRLIWFAIGAAISSMFAVAGIIATPDEPTTEYVVRFFYDPDVWPQAEEWKEGSYEGFYEIGKSIMECDAKYFEHGTYSNMHVHEDFVDFPIQVSDLDAMNCSIHMAIENNIPFEVISRER